MKPSETITWKQQHLNNSCAWACLAMLLTRWGIEKEDRDLIAESLLPYLICYYADDECITAGMLRQSVDVFNTVSSPYGVWCTEHRLSSWESYVQIATTMAQERIPFMTGVSAKSIPTPAYNLLRDTNVPDHGHAIVMFRYADGVWYGFDPSAALDRNQAYSFDDVADQVTLVMPDDTFRTAVLQKPSTRFLLLVAQPGDKQVLPTVQAYLDQSREVLPVFRRKTEELLIYVKSSESCALPIFNNYLFRYIKPIALDFRVTLEQVLSKNLGQQRLCEILQEFQTDLLTLQSFLRNGETARLDTVQRIAYTTQVICELIGQHLDQCPFLGREWASE